MSFPYFARKNRHVCAIIGTMRLIPFHSHFYFTGRIFLDILHTVQSTQF
jgi:hypothetical protein